MVNVTDALTALAAYGVLLIANNELVKRGDYANIRGSRARD